MLNNNFWKVVTTESKLENPQTLKWKNEMWEIRMNREEIKEMMKELKERKAIGLDGISGYILKDCRQ